MAIRSRNTINIFLCGDVMTGRGIDQILEHPSHPFLAEKFVKDARDYVRLAEAVNGTIARNARDNYIWGRALHYLSLFKPVMCLVNLETSITTSRDYQQGKSVHYRMHPINIGCLTSFGMDVCTLANNHVLDWGEKGLIETMKSLERAGIRFVGAGRNIEEATRPVVLPLSADNKAIVYGFGMPSSGIPAEWGATATQPGINLWPGLSPPEAQRIKKKLAELKEQGSIAIASVHWGANWGFNIPSIQRMLAHQLIESGFDIVHGHSSHHIKGIELYRNRLILYGCGDFISDYEGISGNKQYRDDLALMYFVQIDTGSGALKALNMQPLKMKKFQLTEPTMADKDWIHRILSINSKLEGRLISAVDGTFKLVLE